VCWFSSRLTKCQFSLVDTDPYANLPERGLRRMRLDAKQGRYRELPGNRRINCERKKITRHTLGDHEVTHSEQEEVNSERKRSEKFWGHVEVECAAASLLQSVYPQHHRSPVTTLGWTNNNSSSANDEKTLKRLRTMDNGSVQAKDSGVRKPFLECATTYTIFV